MDQAGDSVNENVAVEKQEDNTKPAVENKAESPTEDIIQIKFRNPIQQFLGRNLEVYGPFNAGDVAKLPKELADILLKREQADLV